MKSMTCSDLGAMDCNFKATGNTAQEVKDAMFAHAQSAHPDVLKSMTPAQMEEVQRKMDQLLA